MGASVEDVVEVIGEGNGAEIVAEVKGGGEAIFLRIGDDVEEEIGNGGGCGCNCPSLLTESTTVIFPITPPMVLEFVEFPLLQLLPPFPDD
jgi:hypothetical protein